MKTAGYPSYVDLGAEIAGTDARINIVVAVDPSTGGGLAAGIGSTAIIKDVGGVISNHYTKVGPNDTDWIPTSGWITVATDPRISPGVAARPGIKAHCTGTGVDFEKTGSANTEWEKIQFGGRSKADWFAKYRMLAELKLGIGGVALADIPEDFATSSSWAAVSANGGSGIFAPTANAIGVAYVSTGAGAGSSYMRQATLPQVIINVQTKKWLYATKIYCYGGAGLSPDANTQLFWGIQSATTRVGFGFDGAVDTTHLLIGIFTGAVPANTSSVTQLSTVHAETAINTAPVDAYIYNNGTKLYGSINGEAEIEICATGSLPTGQGWLYPCLANNIGGANTHIAAVDCISLQSER